MGFSPLIKDLKSESASVMANAANKNNTEMARKTATIFDCSICLEEFKNPKYLPCLHTYCETCLQTYIESTANTDNKKTYFACPVCRLSVTLPDSSNFPFENIASKLPFNHLIFSLMTDSKSTDRVTYSCDPCARVGDDVNAIHWCQQCNELLCSPCLKSFHNRLKDSGKHKVLAITEGLKIPKLPDDKVNEPCDEHSGKFYEVFCFDHSEMCCIICLAVNHRECRNIKTLEELVELLAENKIEVKVIEDLIYINREMTKLIEKKRIQVERISAEKDRITSESDRRINEAIDKLEKLKSQIKADASNTCLSKIKPIQEQIDTFSGLNENILQSERFLSTVKDHGNATQVFLTLQKIRKTLHVQRKLFEEAANDETDNLMFELVLDQSLMNVFENKEIPFDLNTQPSKGWKDLSKTEIMKKLDKLAKRFDAMGSLIHRSEDTVQTENNSKGGSNPCCSEYESSEVMKADAFLAESSFEDENSNLTILEGDDKTSSNEDDQDSLNIPVQSFKNISKQQQKRERRLRKRELRKPHKQNVH